MKSVPVFVLSAALAWGLATSPAWAHGETDHSKKSQKSQPVRKEQKPWGIAGDAGKVTRTVRFSMTDDMRFTPDRLEVRMGETLRIVVDNDGAELHEFVLGTQAELDAHAALMAKHPNMEHDEPYMAHVQTGGRGEIVWTFNRAGEFGFACLIASHYRQGMVGKVIVTRAAGS